MRLRLWPAIGGALLALMPVAASADDWDPLLERATSLLQQYLRIDTSNPPGDVRPAASFLIGILRKEGIAHEAFISDADAGKLNLLARLPRAKGAAGRPLLLLHHMDVVPAEPKDWTMGPFSGAIVNDEIWGRGALDMKGIGLAQLAALIRLKQERTPLSRDVLWLAVCDEETGGAGGAKWLTERHWEALDPEFVLDEGGGGSRGLLTDDGRTVFAPAVGEKQPVWLRLSVAGQGGHGSMPHGENPVEVLQQALGRVLAARPELEAAADDLIVSRMKERLGPLADNRYTQAIMKPTIALTSFRAGAGDPPKVNVIPSEASATLDCRLLPGGSVPQFLARLAQVIDDERVRVEVVYQPAERSVASPDGTELFRAIEAVVQAQYPEAVVVPQLVPGGTDSRFFRAKGAVAYGFAPMVFTPKDMELLHGPNERLALSQYRQMIRMYYEIIRRLAQPPAAPQ